MWLYVALIAAYTAAAAAMPCAVARTRCAYRTGCGAALGNYMMMCDSVLNEPVKTCTRECGNALIALTSTEEGKELMNCECEDEFCMETKERIDVCRPQVLNGTANATSSCSLSQLICIADAQCATALDYYHKNCKSLFTRRGTKCSNRCRNSVQILRKQEKAAALTACQCDGNDYRCARIQDNLARFCFHKAKNHTNSHQRHGEKHINKQLHEDSYNAANFVQVPPFLLLVWFWCYNSMT